MQVYHRYLIAMFTPQLPAAPADVRYHVLGVPLSRPHLPRHQRPVLQPESYSLQLAFPHRATRPSTSRHRYHPANHPTYNPPQSKYIYLYPLKSKYAYYYPLE